MATYCAVYYGAVIIAQAVLSSDVPPRILSRIHFQRFQLQSMEIKPDSEDSDHITEAATLATIIYKRAQEAKFVHFRPAWVPMVTALARGAMSLIQEQAESVATSVAEEAVKEIGADKVLSDNQQSELKAAVADVMG